MRHIAFLVAYDGGEFCGSQRQSNGRSVQGELERALQTLFKVETPISLAGRTDAGVHASGQVAKFSTENKSLPTERVPLALNAILSRAVRTRDAREVETTFHPRFSAKSRIYRYRIELARTPNPLLRTIAASIRDELNLEAMQNTAKAFIGTRDFAAWQSAGSPTSSTIREIKRLEIRRTMAFDAEILEIEIEANAFLYQMVRNIVGALIEAGRGQMTGEDVARLTAGLDRTKCPPPAPPQGLCLTQVNY
ncbi:tRNA pseudouridine38-40 synthase [Abditibacterium utsteinense]|uniref:tRNA pseudouridine synthase A n=1 Tax=Abditibacterium utsteinense TaxID=1960156 RepID=A0A2S8ST34_9BACT|nr:tRNA pseudouridine(38-40) synthase TruA [Abditibacterium utsteinense]PQV63974.1 tRNA pseudouridine38-40 synthase [Abditibacterium utsteinense]